MKRSNKDGLMSAFGSELTSRDVRDMVAMEGKAEVMRTSNFVSF
jgi:hypothetical protein